MLKWWQFYLDVGRRMLGALWKAGHLVEGVVAVVFFFVLLFNQDIGTKLLGWEGISPQWAWLPIILLAAHFFLKTVYDKYRELEISTKSAIDNLAEENDELKKDLADATPSKPRAALNIEHDPDCHITKHPNGLVEIRLNVRNDGPERARRVRVKLESLVPQTKKTVASPFSTQFNALRLQVVREELGFALHSGDVAEVILMRAPKGDEFFYIDGYNVKGERDTFKTPRAKYHMSVVANAMNAEPSRMDFTVSPTRSRGVSFKQGLS